MNYTDLPKAIENAAMEAWRDVIDQDGKALSKLFLEDLRRLVRSQKEPWAPLNPAYQARKEKLGLDTRKLIASGKYLEKIRSYRASATRWTVEPPDQLMEKTRLSGKAPKITYRQLAAIHENGSLKMRIPARRHWDPMIEEYKRRAPEFQQLLQRSFNRRLQRRVTRVFTSLAPEPSA